MQAKLQEPAAVPLGMGQHDVLQVCVDDRGEGACLRCTSPFSSPPGTASRLCIVPPAPESSVQECSNSTNHARHGTHGVQGASQSTPLGMELTQLVTTPSELKDQAEPAGAAGGAPVHTAWQASECRTVSIALLLLMNGCRTQGCAWDVSEQWELNNWPLWFQLSSHSPLRHSGG